MRIFLLVICLTVRLPVSELAQNIVVDLVLDSIHWTEKTFFNFGGPRLTEDYKKIIASNDSMFTATPTYFVVEKNLKDEGHICVRFEAINNVTLNLYGRNHPNGPHYRMNASRDPLYVEKCSNEKSCKKIYDCTNGIFDPNFEYSNEDDVVCVSWTTTSDSEATIRKILVQHRDKLAICFDYGNVLEIKKLVAKVAKPQRLWSAPVGFWHTTNQSITTWNDKIDVSNSSLNIPFSHCKECETNFTLKCEDSEPIQLLTEKNDVQEVLFKDYTVISGWQTASSELVNGTGCILTVSTTVNSQVTNAYWAIARKAYLKDSSKRCTCNKSSKCVSMLIEEKENCIEKIKIDSCEETTILQRNWRTVCFEDCRKNGSGIFYRYCKKENETWTKLCPDITSSSLLQFLVPAENSTTSATTTPTSNEISDNQTVGSTVTALPTVSIKTDDRQIVGCEKQERPQNHDECSAVNIVILILVLVNTAFLIAISYRMFFRKSPGNPTSSIPLMESVPLNEHN